MERFFAIDFEEPKFRIFKIFFYLIISNTLENDILMGAKIFKFFEKKKFLGISKVSANPKASTFLKKKSMFTLTLIIIPFQSFQTILLNKYPFKNIFRIIF